MKHIYFFCLLSFCITSLTINASEVPIHITEMKPINNHVLTLLKFIARTHHLEQDISQTEFLVCNNSSFVPKSSICQMDDIMTIKNTENKMFIGFGKEKLNDIYLSPCLYKLFKKGVLDISNSTITGFSVSVLAYFEFLRCLSLRKICRFYTGKNNEEQQKLSTQFTLRLMNLDALHTLRKAFYEESINFPFIQEEIIQKELQAHFKINL